MHWTVLAGMIGVVTLIFGLLIGRELNREERSAPALPVAQAAAASERLTLDLSGASVVYVLDEAGESYTYVVTAPADLNARFAERWIAQPPPGGSDAADVRVTGTGQSTGVFAAAAGRYECWMGWSNARAGDRIVGRITAREDGRLAETSLGDVLASGDGPGRGAPRGMTFSPAGEAIASIGPAPGGLDWHVACRRTE